MPYPFVMNFHFVRRWLLSLCFACSASLLQADEKAADTSPPAKESKTSKAESEPVLELPKIQISQSRLHQIDVEIGKLDKQLAREKKNTKPSELDKTLNNEKIARAAALFGGNSAKDIADVAAARVSLMEAERGILEAMKLPTSNAELEILTKELDQLRIVRRNLDKIRR